jgi:hypothetical protein
MNEGGAGAPVILLHGAFGDRRTLLPVAERLGKASDHVSTQRRRPGVKSCTSLHEASLCLSNAVTGFSTVANTEGSTLLPDIALADRSRSGFRSAMKGEAT